MISMFLVVLALGAGLAGEAQARVLSYEGTLTLEFIQSVSYSGTVSGGGVATVNSSAGRIPLSSLHLASGISGGRFFVPVTDPAVAPIRSIIVDLSLGTGVLAPISGGGSPLTQGQIPIRGAFRLCILFPGCPSSLPVPLTVGGTRGAGIGGTATWGTFATGNLKFSITGAPWTLGATTVASVVRSGFAHGPASATTTTAKEGGVVQLVTPIRMTSGFTVAPIGIIATLRVVLVPEPGTALLLGTGVIALARMGRRRRRRTGSLPASRTPPPAARAR